MEHGVDTRTANRRRNIQMVLQAIIALDGATDKSGSGCTEKQVWRYLCATASPSTPQIASVRGALEAACEVGVLHERKGRYRLLLHCGGVSPAPSGSPSPSPTPSVCCDGTRTGGASCSGSGRSKSATYKPTVTHSSRERPRPSTSNCAASKACAEGGRGAGKGRRSRRPSAVAKRARRCRELAHMSTRSPTPFLAPASEPANGAAAAASSASRSPRPRRSPRNCGEVRASPVLKTSPSTAQVSAGPSTAEGGSPELLWGAEVKSESSTTLPSNLETCPANDPSAFDSDALTSDDDVNSEKRWTHDDKHTISIKKELRSSSSTLPNVGPKDEIALSDTSSSDDETINEAKERNKIKIKNENSQTPSVKHSSPKINENKLYIHKSTSTGLEERREKESGPRSKRLRQDSASSSIASVSDGAAEGAPSPMVATTAPTTGASPRRKRRRTGSTKKSAKLGPYGNVKKEMKDERTHVSCTPAHEDCDSTDSSTNSGISENGKNSELRKIQHCITYLATKTMQQEENTTSNKTFGTESKGNNPVRNDIMESGKLYSMTRSSFYRTHLVSSTNSSQDQSDSSPPIMNLSTGPISSGMDAGQPPQSSQGSGQPPPPPQPPPTPHNPPPSSTTNVTGNASGSRASSEFWQPSYANLFTTPMEINNQEPCFEVWPPRLVQASNTEGHEGHAHTTKINVLPNTPEDVPVAPKRDAGSSNMSRRTPLTTAATRSPAPKPPATELPHRNMSLACAALAVKLNNGPFKTKPAAIRTNLTSNISTTGSISLNDPSNTPAATSPAATSPAATSPAATPPAGTPAAETLSSATLPTGIPPPSYDTPAQNEPSNESITDAPHTQEVLELHADDKTQAEELPGPPKKEQMNPSVKSEVQVPSPEENEQNP